MDKKRDPEPLDPDALPPRSRRRPGKRAAGEGAGPDVTLVYVGIGASAGGLEALRPFVAALPDHAHMTYIVAQHMSPTHRSLMVELLARETTLRVEEARNNLTPKADTIYVAPPNADATVLKGRLRISKPTNTVGPKPSVDRLFISLADDQEDRAIGVILSGTGSDGSRGIKAIKAAGGISIAQEPKTAKYDSMPLAAIRAGGADLVLPPHEIAEQLRAIVQRPRPSIVGEPDEEPPSSIRAMIRQIASHTGMDFSHYKDATISRQILRRMTAKQIPSLEEYGKYIARHREELTELAGNFLICVTSFFRDPESFEAARRILREVLAGKRAGNEIRIWVPGCATGEEVYTIAMILSEELGPERDKYRIQIFATDINSEAVASARAGIYSESALSGVDSTLVERYFIKRDGAYHVDKCLRDMTLFARQDLVQDAPFVRLDMVSCRNLLIYFKGDLQERVMKVFHYALGDDGILFLGKSESIGRLGNLFAEKDRRNKIFVKRPVASPFVGGFARMLELPGREARPNVPAKNMASPAAMLGHERLFELYVPPSLLMTSTGDILEIFGECGDFLTIKTGKADFNAFTLIRPAFRAELRAFAHRVARSKQSAVCHPVEVPGRDGRWRMAVHHAGQTAMSDANLLLVSFVQADERGSPSADGAAPDPQAAERIATLEQELVLNRENLQTVIEELETANEELQSLNEESQAANEELQASNEELETANEELQAANEELITVNDELGTRTMELTETNTDLSNVLDSLQKGLVVVDANLAVTRYNHIARDFFTIPADTRPSLASLPQTYEIPGLLAAITRVLDCGRTGELEFAGGEGQTFLMRLTPYVDVALRAVSGVVLAIVDVTEKKQAEQQLRLSASVFEHASEATMITDADNRILSVNPAFTAITGYSAEEAIGQTPRLLSSGEHPDAFYDEIWATLSAEGRWSGEIHNRRKNGERYVESLSISLLRDEGGAIVRHIGVFRDITEVKVAQETIQRQATFDSLTGLPNRDLTLDRLHQMLSACRRSGNMFAVLFLDLDHFKSINDALGHAAGDELLVQTANRIKSLLRESDSVGRMGGDEFIVLLGDLACAEDIIPVADKILARVHEPLLIAGHTVRTATSIGITVYPMDGDTPEALLKNADGAMYEAKKLGRNTSCFFTHRMQDEANRRHWIDTELESAVARNHLQVHYQPIFRLDDMRLVGAEALMRWKHPVRGFISPEVFIPIAEQNGMIGKLSHWAIETALADWTRNAPRDGPPLSLAFNLSAAQFVSSEHIEDILRLLGPAGRRDYRITIEITESLKLSDNAEYVAVFKRLLQMGCELAIDDFGTGFSSLSYIKRMPFSVIKIDRSFVRDISSDPTDAAMVKAILQLAMAFGMTTVAEGVETAEQLAFLRENGCSYAQGFLFSEPLPYDQFLAFTTSLPPGEAGRAIGAGTPPPAATPR